VIRTAPAALALALTLCVAVPLNPLSAQNASAGQLIGQVTLTPAELEATAWQALRTGQDARALALSEALLLRDPNDDNALHIAARAALAMEQSDVAMERAGTLYRTTQNADLRFTAARIAALAAAQSDRFTMSQLWLRRARQHAPDAQNARAVAADYRAIRQANPWAVSLEFGLTPTSNVNDGTAEDSFDITVFGTPLTLPFNASEQELSGYEIAAGAQLSYRLRGTAQSQTRLNAGVSATLHLLSEDSRRRAPDFDVSALNSWRLSAGVEHFWAMGAGKKPTTLNLTYGTTFVDGARFAHDIQLVAAQKWRVGDAASVTGSVSLGRTAYSTTDDLATLWATNLSYQTALDNGSVLTLSAGVGRSFSDAARYANTFQSLGAGVQLGTIADRFDVDVSADYRWRMFGSGGTTLRTDETARLKVSVGLPEAEFYGFSPVVGIEATHRFSTTTRFNTRGLSMNLGVRSNF